MKALIEKRTVEEGSVSIVSVYLLGLRIYRHRYVVKGDDHPRPIGFVQFPIEAPSEMAEENED